MRLPTEDEIDAGADALRQHDQGGKKLRLWDDLPNSAKRKWRERVSVVFLAAINVPNEWDAILDKSEKSR